MLNIPDNLKRIINDKKELQVIVSRVISCNYIDILINSNQPLFPEYTNHKLPHNQAVLNYMCNLIPEESIQNLTNYEIEVLLYSNILHDLAMHITFAGLHTLLMSELKHPVTGKSWKHLWDLFGAECKELAVESYQKLFRSGSKDGLIEISDNLTKEELLICGEFLRRYHGDLAYCIAMNGYPGSNGQFIKSDLLRMDDIQEISGFIAMSHCYPLRDMDFVLKKRYGENRYKYPFGIHIYYFMGVLRIADYLHAGWDRAPFIINDINVWTSEISKKEWDWNEAVNPEFFWNTAMESLDIMADVNTASVFFKVSKWIQSVQQELDYTWAIVLDKYSGLGMTWKFSIRSITSPVIDNPEMYENKFYTSPVAIQSNVGKIQALLSSYLYNNNPNIAVRELLQNAIDACLVRKSIEKHGYVPLIHIDLYDEGRIIIEDNGIGMNIDDVVNKLLWKGECNKKNLYEDGQLILQNGEFGIGFLSVFMLGNQIEILTRNRENDQGLRFCITNKNEIIDINKCHCSIGTKIIIELKDSPKKLGLKCDWYGGSDDEIKISEYPYMNYYYLDEPKVVYTHNQREIPRNYYYDTEDDDFFGYPDYKRTTEFSLKEWNKIDDFDLYWRFSENPTFYLNGFLMELDAIKNDNLSIVLFDVEHRLKYDLARKNMSNFPYYEIVIGEAKKVIMTNIICRDYIYQHHYDGQDCEFYTETLRLGPRQWTKSQIAWYIDDFLFMRDGFSFVNVDYGFPAEKTIYLMFVNAYREQDYSFLRKIQKTNTTGIIIQQLIFGEMAISLGKYWDFFTGIDKVYIPKDTSLLEELKFKGELVYCSQIKNHPLLDMEEVSNHADKIVMFIEFSNYRHLYEECRRYSSGYGVSRLSYINKKDLEYVPYEMKKREELFEEYFMIYRKNYITLPLSFCITTSRILLNGPV